MATKEELQQKLLAKLRELFQLDQPADLRLDSNEWLD